MVIQVTLEIFLGVLGILFIVIGARAIRRKTIKVGDPERMEQRPTLTYDYKTYTGRKAIIIGWCFVVLGIIFILVIPFLSIVDIID